MAMSVVAALCDSGFLKAGTPLEMASTPVSATAPEENARSSSRTVSPVKSGLPAGPVLMAMSLSDSTFTGMACSPRANTSNRPNVMRKARLTT